VLLNCLSYLIYVYINFFFFFVVNPIIFFFNLILKVVLLPLNVILYFFYFFIKFLVLSFVCFLNLIKFFYLEVYYGVAYTLKFFFIFLKFLVNLIFLQYYLELTIKILNNWCALIFYCLLLPLVKLTVTLYVNMVGSVLYFA
jgi:hypothetical protein